MGNMIFIAGVVSLLSGVALFLFAFRILKPMIKTLKAERNYRRWLIRYGTMSKALSAALIFFGIVSVVQNNPDNFTPYTGSTATANEWSSTDKKELTNECVNLYISQRDIPVEDTDIARNYCECTTEKMTDEFSLYDLVSHDTLSRSQKIELYEPVVETCINNLETQLNERYNLGETQ